MLVASSGARIPRDHLFGSAGLLWNSPPISGFRGRKTCTCSWAAWRLPAGWRLRSARPCSSARRTCCRAGAQARLRFVAGGLADGELGDGAVELRVVLPRADQMVEIGVPGRRGVEGQPACQRVDDDRVETLGFTSGPLSNRVAPQRGGTNRGKAGYAPTRAGPLMTAPVRANSTGPSGFRETAASTTICESPRLLLGSGGRRSPTASVAR